MTSPAFPTKSLPFVVSTKEHHGISWSSCGGIFVSVAVSFRFLCRPLSEDAIPLSVLLFCPTRLFFYNSVHVPMGSFPHVWCSLVLRVGGLEGGADGRLSHSSAGVH